MSRTLIPFGLNGQNKLVDISEVQNGIACECLCPSCKGPLIARQGMLQTWHFAHASRGVFERAQEDCSLSFWVSLRMMSRQVLAEQSLTISLPEYISKTHASNIFFADVEERFTVTPASRIELSCVEVEPTFEGIAVDLLAKVGAFTFIIYLTHQGRPIPDALKTINRTDCGIIAIELDQLEQVFNEGKFRKKTFKACVLAFLTSHEGSKHWVCHPRYDRALAAAEASLQQRLERMTSDLVPQRQCQRPSMRSEPERPRRIAGYECPKCQAQWRAIEGIICPLCFSRGVGY